MAQTVGGSTEFVLGSSGHIQTLISPVGGRAKYFVNPSPAADADEWHAGASAENGSWWPHWTNWLSPRSGEQRTAPPNLGSAHHPVIAPAPGTYVHER